MSEGHVVYGQFDAGPREPDCELISWNTPGQEFPGMSLRSSVLGLGQRTVGWALFVHAPQVEV